MKLQIELAFDPFVPDPPNEGRQTIGTGLPMEERLRSVPRII